MIDYRINYEVKGLMGCSFRVNKEGKNEDSKECNSYLHWPRIMVEKLIIKSH